MSINRYKKHISQATNVLSQTGFFQIFGSTVINQAIAFLSGIILVRILTKGEYGIYSYAYSILNILLIFNGLGGTSGLLQICSETSDKEVQQASYRMANRLSLSFDVVLTIVFLFIALFMPFKLEGTNKMLFVMIFLPITMLIFQLKTIYFRATMKTKEFSLSNTGNSFLVFVFSVIGAFLFEAAGVAIGQTIAYVLSALLITKIFKLSLDLKKPYIDKSFQSDFIKLSLVSAATNGVSQIMNMLDVFILGIVMPVAEVVASYRVGSTIPTALAFIPSAIVTYIYPHFARNNKNKSWLKTNYKKLLIIVSIVNGLISLALVVLAPIIIRIVFGAQYLDSVLVFRILSISYFFSGTFSTISGNILVTQRRLNLNFWRTFFMGLFNALGNFVLIPLIGPTGAAISTVTVNIVCGGIASIQLWKTFNDLPDDLKECTE